MFSMDTMISQEAARHSKKMKIRASKQRIVVLSDYEYTYLFPSLISHIQHHSQAQGWWRDYYDTHPLKNIAGSNAWALEKSQKYKMYWQWASTDNKTPPSQTSN